MLKLIIFINEKSTYHRNYRSRWILFNKVIIKKGYEVFGIKRRTSLINTQRIDEFFNDKKLT